MRSTCTFSLLGNSGPGEQGSSKRRGATTDKVRQWRVAARKIRLTWICSERAQICFDLHVIVDGLEEGGRRDDAKRGKMIGTTKKGIL